MITQNKRVLGIVIAVGLLLSVPLIAMQFTNEVDWGLLDFAIMGTLLLGTGLLCELVLRKIKNKWNRIAMCGVILLGFFLIWAELSVGILGSIFAGS